MNIKEYISSGILESYALGELTELERLDVERNLSQYPELRTELAAIEETMEVFFMKAAKTPGAAVKDKVQKAIAPKVISMTPWRYATAASILIALFSSILAYNYYNNWKQSETQMQVINNPAFERVILKGTANAPEALASLYWNKTTQEVFLSVQNLKTLSKDQQYQLWAIIDGKPVDMGVFDPGTTLLKMKTTGQAAAFAVTIEPRGGKSSPSLETMQVLGNT